MMLVLRGQVKISIVSDEGKELIFCHDPAGECFGEIALLDGQTRTADAIASEIACCSCWRAPISSRS